MLDVPACVVDRFVLRHKAACSWPCDTADSKFWVCLSICGRCGHWTRVRSHFPERNMTTSLRGFSRSWLGHAPNFACTHAAQLPLQSGIKLHRTLPAYGQGDLAEAKLVMLVGGR